MRRTLYFFDDYGTFGPTPELVILDAATRALVARTGLTTGGNLAIAAAAGRVFVNGNDGKIRLLDAATGIAIDELDLEAATGGFTSAGFPLVTDGDRVFLTSQPKTAPGTALRLYAVGRTR